MRADTRVTPYSKIRLKTYAQPVLPFGELVLARRPGAHFQKNQTQFVCGCLLGRDSHTDEHTAGSKAAVFPHANGQETDRGQELVGRSCCRHGMDAVEDLGNDERQATKGCCWREGMNAICERSDCLAMNHHRCLPRIRRRDLESERDATSTSDKPDVQERPPPEPDDERAATTTTKGCGGHIDA